MTRALALGALVAIGGGVLLFWPGGGEEPAGGERQAPASRVETDTHAPLPVEERIDPVATAPFEPPRVEPDGSVELKAADLDRYRVDQRQLILEASEFFGKSDVPAGLLLSNGTVAEVRACRRIIREASYEITRGYASETFRITELATEMYSRGEFDEWTPEMHAAAQYDPNDPSRTVASDVTADDFVMFRGAERPDGSGYSQRVVLSARNHPEYARILQERDLRRARVIDEARQELARILN